MMNQVCLHKLRVIKEYDGRNKFVYKEASGQKKKKR